jgi:hypothetical protein
MIERPGSSVTTRERELFVIRPPGNATYPEFWFCVCVCPEPTIVAAVGFDETKLGAISNVGDRRRLSGLCVKRSEGKEKKEKADLNLRIPPGSYLCLG